MKKYLFLILLLVVGFSASDLKAVEQTSFGSSSGESFKKVGAAGSQFLKVPFGGRGTAIGAYTAIANDLSSIYWNPAGLAEMKIMQAEFSYTQWVSDYSHNFAAFSSPIGGGFNIGLHIINFKSGDIKETTMEKPDGTGASYQLNDMSAGLSLSGFLTEQFSFGLTAKYVGNKMSSVSTGGVAFDIGTMYKTGISGIKLGFAIMNLGSEQKYSGRNLRTEKKLNEDFFSAPLDAEYLSYGYVMPIVFRAGVSGEVWRDGDEHKVEAGVDFVTTSDSPENFVLGAEYTWNDLLMVRAGYKTGNDQFGFSGGVGIKYLTGAMNGQFDYSIAPTKDLGYVNRITLGIGIK